MKAIKDQALDKMLEEMNEKHTPTEDAIHNWLCDQDDEKLFEGILKSDRTIKGAVKFCMSNASKVKDGNVAMISDNTVFEWVFQYFIKEKVDQVEVNATVKTSAEVSAPKKQKPKATKVVKSKTDKPVIGEQLSLLDFL